MITRCGEDFASSFEVSDPGISDHVAVKCKLQFAKPIPQKKKVFYRNLKSVSAENFCTDLQNSELLKSADALDLNELLSCYNQTLVSLLDTHAPLKCCLVPCLPRIPWFTAEIGQAKRKHRQLERKWRKMKTEKSHRLYTSQCRAVNEMINTAKEIYFSSVIDDNKGDQRILFTSIDTLIS